MSEENKQTLERILELTDKMPDEKKEKFLYLAEGYRLGLEITAAKAAAATGVA